MRMSMSWGTSGNTWKSMSRCTLKNGGGVVVVCVGGGGGGVVNIGAVGC